jgi:NAD+ kinase
MKIAIYSRGGENLDMEDLRQFLGELTQARINTVLHEPFFHQVAPVLGEGAVFTTFLDHHDLDDSFDCLISLGGDGTLLDTVTLVRDRNIPVLGINFGRLGFLASIGRNELSAAVQALVNRTFVTDHRTLIHLDADKPLFNGTPYALNEFAIHKRDTSPMIKIHTYLNGEFLTPIGLTG